MKKSINRFATIAMSALLVAAMGATALAATVVSKPRIDDVEFKRFSNNYGYVEVSIDNGYFSDDSAVTVTDSNNKSYDAELVLDWDDDDDDEAVIKVKGLKEGDVYSFNLSKIAAKRSTKTYSLKSSFKASRNMETKYGADGVYYVRD